LLGREHVFAPYHGTVPSAAILVVGAVACVKGIKQARKLRACKAIDCYR
jgi:hypothetical protein